MKITFEQYIKNPMGKQNSVFTQREMYRAMYQSKLDKLLLRENGKVEYMLYKDSDKRYLTHIKIPSESTKNFYYDVVIEFYCSDPIIESSKTLMDYNVRFYSNDPAFIHTFAYSFMHNDIFVTDLENKISKIARTTAAEKTNINNDVGYVKTIYFAYLIMRSKGLFYKEPYDRFGRKYSKSLLLSLIDHSSKKFDSMKEVKQLQKMEELKQKELERRDKQFSSDGIVKRTGNVKRTNGVTKVKTVNVVSRNRKR